MSRLAHRDGLMLAILAAVTLIPAGMGLASLLREMSGEIETLLGLYVASGVAGERDEVGQLRAHGEHNVVVTFDQDIQPSTRAAMNHPGSTPVTTSGMGTSQH